MKDFLKKLIAKKENEEKSLRDRIAASEDVNEVRELGETLRAVLDELESARDQLAEVESKQEEQQKEDENRSFNPLGTYGIGGVKVQRSADPTDSMEYRAAFRDMILSGKPIPMELRQDENTLTSNVSSVIPTVLVNRIIEAMDDCGMILRLVTRTAYAAGVVVPTSTVKPVASWVAEGASSDRQKKTTSRITFAYYKLRCEISMSMEVGTMAISAFEDTFVRNVASAMTIAIEKAILAGTGSVGGQPTGILTETPASGHAVSLATANTWTYADIIAAEAAVPTEYEASAVWFMTKAEFMKIAAMVDSAGQPIARVNMGIDGRLERSILGRSVVLHPYATEMGTVKAGIFDFKDYVLNTIYDMGIQKKQDWDTEDLLTKAVMSVDGKCVNTYSLITVSNPA